MNRKVARAILVTIACLSTLTVTACGKKESKLIEDEATSANGVVDLSASYDKVNTNDDYSDYQSIYSDSDDNSASLDSAVSDDAAVSNDSIDVSSNSISGNKAVASDNAVSGNLPVAGQAVPDYSVSNSNANVSDNLIYDYDTTNNELIIANLSGKNIKELYITFNAGELNNVEILNGKKLKDGQKFIYEIKDMESLRNASSLTLKITAGGSKEAIYEFNEIKVIDPTDMNVVLTKEAEDYIMYLN